MDSPTQRIWRTMSESPNSGFFVWEVLEVIGEPIKYLLDKGGVYMFTRDIGYVCILCLHFWTRNSAIKYLKSQDEFLGQKVIVID